MQISRPCPDCNASAVWLIGQRVDKNNELMWYQSIRCDRGCSIEEDGFGQPPPELRNTLLQVEGRWALVIPPDANRVCVLNILRSALKLDMSRMRLMLKRLPGPIWQGTKTEVNRLKELLGQEGVTASVVPES